MVKKIRKVKRKRKKNPKKEDEKKSKKVVGGSSDKVDKVVVPKPKNKQNKELIARLRRSAKLRKDKGKFGGKKKPTNFGKKKNSANIEAKLQHTMKQQGGQDIPDIDEVNIFKKGDKVIHFEKPRVTAAMNANTYVVAGEKQRKTVDELMPHIITQLPFGDRDKFITKHKENESKDGVVGVEEEDEDSDIPEVETFDEVK